MISTLKYINRTKNSIEIVLEPWAEEFLLMPNQKLELIAEYEGNCDYCQMEQNEDCVVFFAWEHSLVKVFIDGEDKTKTSGSIKF